MYDIYLEPDPPAIVSWANALPLKYSDSFMDPKRVKILRGVPKGFLAIDDNGSLIQVGDRFTNIWLVKLIDFDEPGFRLIGPARTGEPQPSGTDPSAPFRDC